MMPLMEPENNIIEIHDSSGGEKGQASSRPTTPLYPNELPILGLIDVVVFPGMSVPLIVESPSSIRLIDDVVAGNRMIGLVLQKNPDTESPKPEELHNVGCLARVVKMLKFPDGSIRLLIEGLKRLKIKKYIATDPYLKAEIEILTEIIDESLELTVLQRSVRQLFDKIMDLSPGISEQLRIAVLNTENPSRLADLIAVNLGISLEEKQTLLELINVKERLSKLLIFLNREYEVLILGSKIQQEVASSISKSQKDYFLREQMRVIQKELGETDATTAELNNLRELVEKNKLPEEARQVAYKELDRLQRIPPNFGEYIVIRNYLDWLITVPWNKFTDDKIDIKTAEKILDDQHYGLKKVKERLLEYIAVVKLNSQIKGPILCLVGPPGVGKTSLGKSVADALGRKFARISLGGMRDEAEIRGHRRTYVGAMPGRIIQTLRRVESKNPVILLDELDKIGSDFRGDPASALLEVLDPQQNSTFLDHYLDIPFDLSKVLFITTANWLDPISPALRDRLEVIELPSYTEQEKIEIAKRFLIPRQLDEHGLKRNQVIIPKTTIQKIIRNYTREAGLRQLEREIASLVRKAAKQFVSNMELGKTGKPLRNISQNNKIRFDPDDLDKLLGPIRFLSETSEKITEPGIVIGLAWTPVGGEIIFIEATRMPGKGNLILTGSLGDVMKESAHAALSYLRSQSLNIGIDLTDYDKYDIHIHVPAGATPKDGPSAGVAIVTALASLLSKRIVFSDLAMTGEISLRGRVLPVGGIKEKVLSCVRSGIKKVILPNDNQKDLYDIPEEIKRRTKFYFVKRISDIFPIALKPAEHSVKKPGR